MDRISVIIKKLGKIKYIFFFFFYKNIKLINLLIIILLILGHPLWEVCIVV